MVCHHVLHFSSLLNTHLYAKKCPSPWNRTFQLWPLQCFSFLSESTSLSSTTLDSHMVDEWLKHAEQLQTDSTISTSAQPLPWTSAVGSRLPLWAPRAVPEPSLGPPPSSSWGEDQATCCCLWPQHTAREGAMGCASRSHGREDQGIKTAGSAEHSPWCKIGCWELEVLHSAKLGCYHPKFL